MRPPIIHRDLRSPNIFVTSLDENVDVMAKVADFGLASKVLTSLNEVLFTWQWLAPEVIDSDSGQYDERADTYSYGIVLWEIATRQYPFAEFEQYITKYAVLPPPSLSSSSSASSYLRLLPTLYPQITEL
jgi:serine/threonine protein kinase